MGKGKIRNAIWINPRDEKDNPDEGKNLTWLFTRGRSPMR